MGVINMQQGQEKEQGQETSSPNQPNFAPSVDSQILEAKLRTIGVGEVVSYKELEAAIGRSVKAPSQGYAALRSARKRLVTQGMAFGVVTREGLRRLDSPGVLEQTSSERRRIGKAARRSRHKLESATRFEELNSVQQIQYAAEMAVLQCTEGVAKESGVRKLSSKLDPRKRLHSDTEILMAQIEAMKG